MSPSSFKHYYETVFIPMLKSIVGHDFPLSHTRHYVDPTSTPIGALQNEHFQYDVVTVYTFVDKQHWERFQEKCERDENKVMLRQAEDTIIREGGRMEIGVGDTKSTGRDGGEVGWRFVASF